MNAMIQQEIADYKQQFLHINHGVMSVYDKYQQYKNFEKTDIDMDLLKRMTKFYYDTDSLLFDEDSYVRLMYVMNNADFDTDKPTSLFFFYDSNYNQTINEEQLYTIIHRLGYNVLQGEVHEIMQQLADKNGEQMTLSQFWILFEELGIIQRQ
ncbi:EF_hand domain-containing protein [Hexamita inflata]|uniref:EF hand domain-containing protein n=1 Tax=Hexamita inflata TaxID=28002 RepID=A0AA86NZT0_9EUKA|nr:EF hand domain-containing protein [Hexamita inflata]